MVNKGFDDVLTPLQQRWLALGLLLFVSLIIGLIVIVPVLSKAWELYDTRKNLMFKLEQYERILAKKDAVTAGIDKIKEQSKQQGYFNGQETEALASAEMQEFIKTTISNAGGQLNSTQPITSSGNPNDTAAKFNRIIVRVSLTGNSEMLRSVLYKIETAMPFMIVDQIDIRPVRGKRNRKTGQIEPGNDMAINLQVVSFMRKPPQ